MTVTFAPLTPWTKQTRRDVKAVASNLADLDDAEIFGLRPSWHTAADLTADIASIIASGLLLDGFVAARDDGRTPMAVAMAYRTSLPRVAEIAMFGAKGHERAVPAVYRELASRQEVFARQHDMCLAQLPVLKDHRAARRMIARMDGIEAFDYGPIGRDGQSYTHVIWRF